MSRPRILTVGAGPAGSSFAIAARRAGLDCTLLDARNHPRPKLCGGGITKKTRDLAISILGEEVYRGTLADTSNEIELYYDGRRATRFTTENVFDFVDRSRYDLAYIETFRHEGGEFLPEVRATGIDLEKKRLITTAGGFDFDILVCADGATSALRRIFEPDYRPEGFCYEYSAPNTEGNLVRVDFFSDMKGYSWSFPNGDSRVLGTGCFYRHPVDARDLRRFLAPYGPIPDRVQGAFIPLGNNPLLAPLAGGTVHFLGDAAGWANPVTGEGLYWALKYSLILASHLAGRMSAPAYARELAALGRSLRLYDRAQDIVYSHKVWERLVNRGKPGSGYRRVCDGMISCDTSPAAFLAGHLWRKACRSIGIDPERRKA